jgi:hypothetical protein
MAINRKTVNLDSEGAEAWERLSENWIMSKMLNNFILSFESNFSKYKRLVDLEILPDDLFDRISDGDVEWIAFFKHLKSVAWRKSND